VTAATTRRNDNPTWFKKYIDPQFKYSVLASQLTGVALLRLADAELLPLDYEVYGRQILEYVDENREAGKPGVAGRFEDVDFAGLKAAAEAVRAGRANLRSTGETLLGRRIGPRQMNTADAMARQNHALHHGPARP